MNEHYLYEYMFTLTTFATSYHMCLSLGQTSCVKRKKLEMSVFSS